MLSRFLVAVAAMVVVVAASNILVLYPFAVQLGSVDLADLLTWGAFTFPFAFLITDLTNRYDGPQNARRVVLVGFLVGLALSFYLSFNPLPWNAGGSPATTQRIALASAAAFLSLSASSSSFFPSFATGAGVVTALVSFVSRSSSLSPRLKGSLSATGLGSTIDRGCHLLVLPADPGEVAGLSLGGIRGDAS